MCEINGKSSWDESDISPINEMLNAVDKAKRQKTVTFDELLKQNTKKYIGEEMNIGQIISGMSDSDV